MLQRRGEKGRLSLRLLVLGVVDRHGLCVRLEAALVDGRVVHGLCGQGDVFMSCVRVVAVHFDVVSRWILFFPAGEASVSLHLP